jgi:hypothetical protein
MPKKTTMRLKKQEWLSATEELQGILFNRVWLDRICGIGKTNKSGNL